MNRQHTDAESIHTQQPQEGRAGTLPARREYAESSRELLAGRGRLHLYRVFRTAAHMYVCLCVCNVGVRVSTERETPPERGCAALRSAANAAADSMAVNRGEKVCAPRAPHPPIPAAPESPRRATQSSTARPKQTTVRARGDTVGMVRAAEGLETTGALRRNSNTNHRSSSVGSQRSQSTAELAREQTLRACSGLPRRHQKRPDPRRRGLRRSLVLRLGTSHRLFCLPLARKRCAGSEDRSSPRTRCA